MKNSTVIFLAFVFLNTTASAATGSAVPPAPYGKSSFVVWNDLGDMEQLKVAWDFNFDDPAGVARALNPVSFALKATAEHGPVNFDPMQTVVVSHGGEVAVWARKNYPKYKDIVDRAARLAKLGVRFEVCSTAAEAQGFEPGDFHGFINVVPTGSFALIYWSRKGFAIVPAGSTVPSRVINETNRKVLARRTTSQP